MVGKNLVGTKWLLKDFDAMKTELFINYNR